MSTTLSNGSRRKAGAQQRSANNSAGNSRRRRSSALSHGNSVRSVIAVAIATYVCGLMLSAVVMEREQEIQRMEQHNV
jgi:hypothetical protein